MPNVVTSDLPDPHHPHIRDIVEEERLSQILENLGVSVHKLERLLSGLTNTIARNPDRFARESHTGWSRIVIKAFPPEIPFVAIWFTYDDDYVYIQHIQPLQS